jgi:hypothetical protein
MIRRSAAQPSEQTSQNTYLLGTSVNKGKKRRAGAQDGTPTRTIAAPLERYFWGAGHSSGAGGVSTGTRGRCDSAVGLSAAWWWDALAAHLPAGMNSWMNANAGAAVMDSINTEIKAAATKTDSFFLNNTSLQPSSPFEERSWQAPPPELALTRSG